MIYIVSDNVFVWAVLDNRWNHIGEIYKIRKLTERLRENTEYRNPETDRHTHIYTHKHTDISIMQ